MKKIITLIFLAQFGCLYGQIIPDGNYFSNSRGSTRNIVNTSIVGKKILEISGYGDSKITFSQAIITKHQRLKGTEYYHYTIGYLDSLFVGGGAYDRLTIIPSINDWIVRYTATDVNGEIEIEIKEVIGSGSKEEMKKIKIPEGEIKDYLIYFEKRLTAKMNDAVDDFLAEVESERESEINETYFPNGGWSDEKITKIVDRDFKGGEVLRVLVYKKDYDKIKKNDLGVPERKLKEIYFAFKDDSGTCYLRNTYISKEYEGGGNYSSSPKLMGSLNSYYGSKQKMNCNNVNKMKP